MLIDGSDVFLKELGHLFLGQPYGFFLKLYFKSSIVIGGLIDQDRGLFWKITHRRRISYMRMHFKWPPLHGCRTKISQIIR